ncbi:LPXTG cell wall anchor domain-containing protein [Pseudoclavibacter helvolus]|uniref:LPXTG cell wall anchor domain-containing protein n=1 Tax=Pseudoclavibacter helvolus TaxID=255205 RepID=UPI0024ADD582|nr:LPXTG cell wall anchor domain-containing protein [Pseudoclavibacter helvolus]
MPDNSGPRSLAEKFWTTCLYLFGGVILLTLAIEFVKNIWVYLLIGGLVVLLVAAGIWWWRRRNGWD